MRAIESFHHYFVPSYEESLLENIDLREPSQLQNFLLRTLESEEKEDTHAFIRYGGNGEVYPPPTPTRPLGITRTLPDITPTRLRPSFSYSTF